MSNPSHEFSHAPGRNQDPTTAEVAPDTSPEPFDTAGSMRARLARSRSLLGDATARVWPAGRPPAPGWFTRISEKAAPVVDGARAFRVPIVAALGALAGVLVALRRRGGDPVIDEAGIDLGDWHVIGEPYRLQKSA